jgi:hypothetical protein
VEHAFIQTSYSRTTWSGQVDLGRDLHSGTAVVRVRGAVDAIGNVMLPNLNAGSFTIDMDNPTAFDLITPADSSWTNQGQPTLSWGASNDTTTGIARYRLYINGNRE